MADLVIRKLGKTYFDLYAGRHVTAVNGVSLEIHTGEFVSIVGPSGCGKTTLLNMVAGFILPSEGEILLGGRQVKGPGPDRGVVFQNFALFPWKTVLDNVAFGLKVRGLPREERERIAGEYVALVGLTGSEVRYPNELSGGMQQRVGVARALANSPELLLMDEPFASVDAQTRMTLQEELTRIWDARHPTILFVTHDVDEAVFLSDRVIVLTQSPGTVRAEIPIALPRPRSWSRAVEDNTFKALVAKVLALVRDADAHGSAPAPEGSRGVIMRRLARVWASRRGRILVIALLFYLSWQVWLTVQAPGKIAPDINHTVSLRGTVDLLVTLPFPPERFHILTFQRYGRVSGTSGNTAEVRGVKLAEVTGLARYYWVRRVEALPDSQRSPSSG